VRDHLSNIQIKSRNEKANVASNRDASPETPGQSSLGNKIYEDNSTHYHLNVLDWIDFTLVSNNEQNTKIEPLIIIIQAT
jgi:hypothetical protein